jgi:hypothetical protein
MGFFREIGINTGWIKPKPGEFLPEHEELGLAYQIFDLTYRDSRIELERRKGEEEIVVNLLGQRIKERALRVTAASISAAFYTRNLMGPHYFRVGNSYLFSLKSQRLLVTPASEARFDPERLEDAPPQAWFVQGKAVVDGTLSHLSEFHGLPRYLTRIEIPR